MAYSKTTWDNNTSPAINATNLNKMETGIDEAHDMATGRCATFVVAANDSSTLSKQQADYVCDGTADDVQIHAAIDTLPASGGKVYLMEGTYTLSNEITGVSNLQLIITNGATLSFANGATPTVHTDLLATNFSHLIYFTNVNNVRIENYGILNPNHDSVVNNVCGIFIKNSSNSYIHGGKITNSWDGIISVDCEFLTVENVYSDDCYSALVCDEGSHHSLFRNLYLTADTFSNGREVLDLNGRSEWCVCEEIFGDQNIDQIVDITESPHTILRNIVSGSVTNYEIIHITPRQSGIRWSVKAAINNCNDILIDGVYGISDRESIHMFFSENYQIRNATICNVNTESKLRSIVRTSKSGAGGWDNLIDGLSLSNIKGKMTESTKAGILIDDVVGANKNIMLSNIQIESNFHYGFRIACVDGLTMVGCTVKDCEFFLYGCTNFNLSACKTFSENEYGLYLQESTDGIINMIAQDIGWSAIYIVGVARRLVFNGCAFDNVNHYAFKFDNATDKTNIKATNSIFHSIGSGIQNITLAEFLTDQKYSDLLMDVLAVSATHVRSNEDLSVATPITFTLDAQPDVPRTLSWSFDSHTQITEYDMEVIGVDAKGNTVTETWDETAGWSGETSNAFATITSIKMTSRTGTGAGDTMDIGITDVLGLSNIIYATSDVFKIKKNNANATVATAQVNTTYDTYDMSVITLGAGDDFTIWYKSNLNIIS